MSVTSTYRQKVNFSCADKTNIWWNANHIPCIFDYTLLSDFITTQNFISPNFFGFLCYILFSYISNFLLYRMIKIIHIATKYLR